MPAQDAPLGALPVAEEIAGCRCRVCSACHATDVIGFVAGLAAS
jgi:hypothetical protein